MKKRGSHYWKFLWLGVDPEGDDPPDPAPDEPIEITAQKDDPDEPLQRLRKETEDLRRELEDTRRRFTATPAATPQPQRDPEFDREEQQLAEARRQGADQNTVQWMQWQIDTNRRVRAAERTAQSATIENRELADRSEFSRLEISDPKTYKAYKDRVEKFISDARAQGNAAPQRMLVLKYLIGDDAMNGRNAPKPKGDTAPGKTVDRTRIPSTRGDVNAKASKNERDARRARLENLPI